MESLDQRRYRYNVFGIEMSYEDMVTLGPRIARQREMARKRARPVEILTFDLG